MSAAHSCDAAETSGDGAASEPPFPAAATGPYPGLRAFQPGEALVFCGRSEQRIDMLTRLERSRFLAVLGASGSGKSSLVMAGLLPDVAGGLLRPVSADAVRLVIFRPGLNPYRALAGALAEIVGAGSAAVEAVLRGSSAVGLARVFERFSGSHVTGRVTGLAPRWEGERVASHEKPAIVIVADQFEELFRFAALRRKEIEQPDFLQARCGVPVLDGAHNEAQGFIDLLLNATMGRQHAIYVVLTMRSDFLHRCETFERLPTAISDNQYTCARLRRDQAEEAIRVPATRFQGAVGPELLNLLLNELSPDPDQLPVLQHLLARMWEHALADGMAQPILGLKHYRAVGGLDDAINRHGDELLQEVCKHVLAPVDSAPGTIGGRAGKFVRAIPAKLPIGRWKRRMADPRDFRLEETKRVFRCLAEWSEANLLVRRPRRATQIAAETGLTVSTVLAITGVFRRAGNHWLKPSTEPIESSDADPVFDLAHESLLRRWSWLADAMAQEHQQRDAFVRLREMMAECGCNALAALSPRGFWQRGWQKFRAVWRANLSWFQIARFRKALTTPRPPAEAWAERYGGAWKPAGNFLAEARCLRWALRGFWMSLVAIAIWIALSARVNTVRRDLAAQVNTIRHDQLQAQTSLEVEKARRESLAKSYEMELRRRDSLLEIEKQRLLEVSETLRRYVEDNNRVFPVSNSVIKVPFVELADAGTVFSSAFYHGGEGFMTAAADGIITTWNPTNGEQLKMWPLGHRHATTQIAVDAESRYAIAAAGTAYLCNLKQGWTVKAIDFPDAPDDAVTCVAFRPGDAMDAADDARGKALQAAAGGKDGQVRLWTVTKPDGARTPQIFKHTGVVTSLAFDGNGSQLTTSCEDGTLRRWTLPLSEKNQLPSTVPTGAPVRSAVFSADGSRIVAASGKDALVWAPTLKSIPTPVSNPALVRFPHSSPVIQAVFSPDGSKIASASADGALTLWDVETQKPRVLPVSHSGRILRLAWASDWLVAACEDGNVGVWNLRFPESIPTPYRSFHAHNGPVWSVEFSADGHRFATTSAFDDKFLPAAEGSARRTGSGLSHTPDNKALLWTIPITVDLPDKGPKTRTISDLLVEKSGFLRTAEPGTELDPERTMLFYSTDVSPDEIRATVSSLLDAGVSLKGLGPSSRLPDRTMRLQTGVASSGGRRVTKEDVTRGTPDSWAKDSQDQTAWEVLIQAPGPRQSIAAYAVRHRLEDDGLTNVRIVSTGPAVSGDSQIRYMSTEENERRATALGDLLKSIGVPTIKKPSRSSQEETNPFRIVLGSNPIPAPVVTILTHDGDLTTAGVAARTKLTTAGCKVEPIKSGSGPRNCQVRYSGAYPGDRAKAWALLELLREEIGNFEPMPEPIASDQKAENHFEIWLTQPTVPKS